MERELREVKSVMGVEGSGLVVRWRWRLVEVRGGGERGEGNLEEKGSEIERERGKAVVVVEDR